MLPLIGQSQRSFLGKKMKLEAAQISTIEKFHKDSFFWDYLIDLTKSLKVVINTLLNLFEQHHQHKRESQDINNNLEHFDFDCRLPHHASKQ